MPRNAGRKVGRRMLTTLVVGSLFGIVGLSLLPDDKRNSVINMVRGLKDKALKLVEDKGDSTPKVS
ncbi:MAG: hypothetical protein HY226_06155 [Candidatus Vogelbacteria bacterium]|nr:hypothetical protein [Candidatus Vogelbacteria bacterium]